MRWERSGHTKRLYLVSSVNHRPHHTTLAMTQTQSKAVNSGGLGQDTGRQHCPAVSQSERLQQPIRISWCSICVVVSIAAGRQDVRLVIAKTTVTQRQRVDLQSWHDVTSCDTVTPWVHYVYVCVYVFVCLWYNVLTTSTRRSLSWLHDIIDMADSTAVLINWVIWVTLTPSMALYPCSPPREGDKKLTDLFIN